ncbi:hypothetical protein CA850_17160 [Micromonospora echinospora]|uniref:Bacterial Ig-like domain-containing protein n=1 Tax=Micromonospora echinospora TaxID=1877 RepID=A0A1C4WWE9_MICEC|nr:hypothetical protein [Micromonospora echinospora]OZV79774.1 hypothetical protein CA850_17160 [Micromonospora echinospora]SCF00493.1 hypothetical protein GA0070618_2572 [Micromonospora echinospora]
MSKLKIGLTAIFFTIGGVLAAPAGLAAPASTADTAPPVLKGITVTPDRVSVSGVDLVPVTVSVRLTDESGVMHSVDMDGVQLPYVVLTRVPGGPAATQGAELALTSGTAQDGVWSATIQVPSTWDGRWELSRVVAVDEGSQRLDVDPRNLPLAATLDVTGTHRPAVTMEFVPDPLVGDGRLTVRGRFFYEDTGKGIPDQPIFFGEDNLCVEHPGVPNGRTAADGSFSKVYPQGEGFLRCVGILRPSNIAVSTAFIVVASRHPRVKPTVTAKVDRTSVPPGTKVTFTGTVEPSSASSLELQEQVDGTWRTVVDGTVGDGGRYTLPVTPKGAGGHRYRVIVPNSDPELVGASQAVVVQVTGGGSGGGDGSDTLPITGLPPVLPMAGGALALIFAGVGLTLAGRRRRVATVSAEH